MINNAHELFVTLHQLSSFTDMLEAIHLSAEERHDYREFAHLSPAYMHKIRELNAEVREYLKEHPDAVEAGKTAVLA